MKKAMAVLAVAALVVAMVAPAALAEADAGSGTTYDGEVSIVLSDDGITVDGEAASEDSSSAVYVGADIVYYEDGTDSSYGAGSSSDMHTEEEAAMHTVVTITAAGTYRISGTLSYGQIAVDVGDGEDDIVTLVLDGVDITCTVAPAIIFYEVWESGDADTATTDIPDETGANVIIADGSYNTVTGSHVAKIYKEGTTKKLHKYDAAFYSKVSMTVDGESEGTGVLVINADYEGLDAELHLTINGGIIEIYAQDDGINTNEDYISVTRINGGTLYINGGLGSEGDGIDSNGYIVINGGTIYTSANSSADGGIDADCDILLNGGTLIAIGGSNDSASSSSEQAYMELTYSSTMSAGKVICLMDSSGNVVIAAYPDRSYQSVTISTPDMEVGETYYLYSGGSCTGTLTYGLYLGGTHTGGTLMQYTGTSSSGAKGGMSLPGSSGWGGTKNTTSGSTEFTLSTGSMTFSGVSASASSSSKTEVTFEVEYSDDGTSITSITAYADGVEVDVSDYIQVTIQDYPSESYFVTVSGLDIDAINEALPTDSGTYLITIAVTDSCDDYTGVYQALFEISDDGDVEVTEGEYSTNEDTSDGTSGGSSDDGDNTTLIIVAAAVVIIVIIAAAAFFIVRKDRGPNRGGPGPL